MNSSEIFNIYVINNFRKKCKIEKAGYFISLVSDGSFFFYLYLQ